MMSNLLLSLASSSSPRLKKYDFVPGNLSFNAMAFASFSHSLRVNIGSPTKALKSGCRATLGKLMFRGSEASPIRAISETPMEAKHVANAAVKMPEPTMAILHRFLIFSTASKPACFKIASFGSSSIATSMPSVVIVSYPASFVFSPSGAETKSFSTFFTQSKMSKCVHCSAPTTLVFASASSSSFFFLSISSSFSLTFKLLITMFKYASRLLFTI
mmetsp:Transcript_4385/g.14347  ORF Transcript_4385/g.14347 Transcript_4385/m.14347 type:complete len:216 (-) Transcript_4385:723-1370(-)